VLSSHLVFSPDVLGGKLMNVLHGARNRPHIVRRLACGDTMPTPLQGCIAQLSPRIVTLALGSYEDCT
jgi:hypothetical protein